MKPQPRRSEREIAARMQEIERHFYPHSNIERIPVLGRTGPDITTGKLDFVVDVKSRVSVPLSALAGKDEVLYMTDGDIVLVGLRIELLGHILTNGPVLSTANAIPSKMIFAWWKHMEEWRLSHSGSVSCIIVRRPGMDYDHSTVWVELMQLSRRMEEIWQDGHLQTRRQ